MRINHKAGIAMHVGFAALSLCCVWASIGLKDNGPFFVNAVGFSLNVAAAVWHCLWLHHNGDVSVE